MNFSLATNMTPDLHHTRAVTRRHFFKTSGLGFGAMALHALLSRNSASAAAAGANPLAPKAPMIAPRAKRVIYLHMAGSPSQLELFENKPELAKLTGQNCPKSFLE